jgi:hypothetical protein
MAQSCAKLWQTNLYRPVLVSRERTCALLSSPSPHCLEPASCFVLGPGRCNETFSSFPVLDPSIVGALGILYKYESMAFVHSVTLWVLFVAFCSSLGVYGWYLPGTYPKEFNPGQEMHGTSL